MKKVILALLLSLSLFGCGASKGSLYREANLRIEEGDYDEGYKILLSLDDYKDSREIVVNSLSERIDAAMKEKDLEHAKDLLDEIVSIDASQKQLDLLEKINTYYSLLEVNVGDTIEFGSYLQNGEEAEPIDWIVLDKFGDDLFITTKNIIEVSPYHDEQRTVTWQGCALRKFLNETLYNDAFSDVQREFIDVTYNMTRGSPDTEDYLFCLSIDEVQKYFVSDEARICFSTQYAKDKGVYVYEKTGGTYYWLRSQGSSVEKAAYVFASGEITDTSKSGLLVYTDNSDGGVRVAMRINTNIFNLEPEETEQTK